MKYLLACALAFGCAATPPMALVVQAAAPVFDIDAVFTRIGDTDILQFGLSDFFIEEVLRPLATEYPVGYDVRVYFVADLGANEGLRGSLHWVPADQAYHLRLDADLGTWTPVVTYHEWAHALTHDLCRDSHHNAIFWAAYGVLYQRFIDE